VCQLSYLDAASGVALQTYNRQFLEKVLASKRLPAGHLSQPKILEDILRSTAQEPEWLLEVNERVVRR
jgi:hypothetical protein